MTRTAAAQAPEAPEPRVRGSESARVYKALWALIVRLELTPGADLDENQLVQRFGTSRTPVREALIRLASEGLVVLLPGRSARVAPMNLSDIKSHLEALDLLQPAVCHWAAVRRSAEDLARIDGFRRAFEAAAEQRHAEGMIEANYDFHDAIGVAARNPAIEKAHRSVLTDQLRIARIAMTGEYFGSENAYFSHLERIIGEHRATTEAIAEGDATRAEEIGRKHAELGRIRIADYLTISLAKYVRVPEAGRG